MTIQSFRSLTRIASIQKRIVDADIEAIMLNFSNEGVKILIITSRDLHEV